MMTDTEDRERHSSRLSSEEACMLLSRLHRIDTLLCQEPRRAKDRLCHEVLLITQGRAQLHLFTPERGASLSPLSASRQYPVKHLERSYGILELLSSSERVSPELPPLFAEVCATTCAMLLYTVEMSAIVKEECQQYHVHPVPSLTKQQQRVLTLICQHYSTPAIAEQLQITPKTVGTHKQNIYRKLKVESEHEARLIAFCLGFKSPLDR